MRGRPARQRLLACAVGAREGQASLFGTVLGDQVKAAARPAGFLVDGRVLPGTFHPAGLFQPGQDRIDRARRQSRQLAQLKAVPLLGGILQQSPQHQLGLQGHTRTTHTRTLHSLYMRCIGDGPLGRARPCAAGRRRRPARLGCAARAGPRRGTAGRAACVAAAERFEVGGGALMGGGVDVDEVADRAAVRERADLGADHVVEGRHRSVLGLRGRTPDASLRTSTSHSSPDCGSVAIRRPERAPVSIRRTLQPRVARPSLATATISAIEAGFSVATSRSWLRRSTRPWAWTA